MSEQNQQRGSVAQQDAPAKDPPEDPLEELARIVSGKDEPVPPENLDSIEIDLIEPEEIVAEPVHVVPEASPGDRPAPDLLSDDAAYNNEITAVSDLEASLRDENMDLESLLMAELAPDLATMHEVQEVQVIAEPVVDETVTPALEGVATVADLEDQLEQLPGEEILNFDEVFTSELEQALPVEPVGQNDPNMIIPTNGQQNPDGATQPEHPVQQPGEFASNVDIGEQQIEASVDILQIDVADDLNNEGVFSDAFADEFSMEMEAPEAVDPALENSTEIIGHEQPKSGQPVNDPVPATPPTEGEVVPVQLEADLPLSPPQMPAAPISVAVQKNSGFRMAAIALGLAIVAGAGIVGYEMFAEPEISGEPEVVRADQSEFRVKPDDPGGKQIANQDQPVYDAMAGDKGDNADEGGQETLIVSPVEPIDIAPADTAERPEKTAERLNSGEIASLNNTAVAVMQPRKVKTVTVLADGTILASTPVGAEDQVVASSTSTPPRASAASEEAITIDQQAIENDIARSKIAIPSANPRPRAEPAQLALAQPVQETTLPSPVVNLAENPAPVAALTPATTAPVSTQVPAGAYVVQISSQRSMEAAEATYQNLKRRFSGILEGQPKEILAAKVEGKGTFYRVRIPIGSQNDAANFCGRYKSAGGSCFVTR